MATFIRRVRPLGSQSNYLSAASRSFLQVQHGKNKNLLRCFSQVLRGSSKIQNIRSRQLERCIRIIQRNKSTDQVASEVVKAATDVSSTIPKDVNYIPAPPKAPSEILPPEFADISDSLNALGEPTLQSLGLGGYFPPGLIQQCLEYLHVQCGLPWYASIATLTVVLRILIFPLFVKQQRINVKMQNHMPTLKKFMDKRRESKLRGDRISEHQYMREEFEYREKHGIGLLTMLAPLGQAPIFVSMFFGTRGMTELPVQSMKTGGILWFPDLTLPDPYFGLPIITSATLLAIVHLGSEFMSPDTMNRAVRVLMYSSPVLAFLFMQSFPAATLVYWTSNNFISLIQSFLFRQEVVRQYLGIPKRIEHPKKKKEEGEEFSVSNLFSKAKEKVREAKIQQTMHDRDRINAEIFKKSGEGPIPKTYSYDPTKVKKTKKIKVRAS